MKNLWARAQGGRAGADYRGGAADMKTPRATSRRGRLELEHGRTMTTMPPDIVSDECKSIIATLHGPSAYRAGVRTDRVAKARAMAGQEIDRLSDPSATKEERQRRKRWLLKGPKSSEMFAATVPTPTR